MNIPGSSLSANSFALGESTQISLNNAKTFALPNKCFEKHIAAVWRRGNQLGVYPRSQKTSQPGEGTTDNCIVNIRQDIMLFTPIVRKLVNESNGTFTSLQTMAEELKNTDNQVEYVKISRQYRSIVRVCIENLQEAANTASDSLEKNELLSYITIFYSIECIWHLCEILYIDNIPGDVVLPYLLEWVRFHFPCHEQTAAGFLENCEKGSEENPEYWDTVIGMIVQGRIDVSRALLKLHTASETNEFRLVDNALRTMPVYSVYGGISSGEFTISWKHWQAECRSKLSSGSLASQPQLELITRLLIGDYSSWESIRDKYDSWFDLLGGWVLFTCPTGRRRELSAAAAACAGMRGRGASRTPLDIAVRALTDGDLHQLLHETQQMSDNGWFATHLTDLLYHCGKLKTLDEAHSANTSAQLRDSLILEYGSTLFEHQSLWSVGVSYFMASPREGVRRAELMMERIPITSEAKALAVIAEAEQYGLVNVARSVARCQSARLLSLGRAGGALGWAARARAGGAAARAADAALRTYCATGHLPAADLLLTLGPNMLLCDRTVLLCKYCEFHKLYKSKDFKNAAKLLVSLITSKIVPDYMWSTVLLDTLPLLEADSVQVGATETGAVMAALELRGDALSQDQAQLLRLALVRNLARAQLAPDDA